MNNEEQKIHTDALIWWDNLADISIQMPSKSHLCKLYHGDMRIHKSLKPSEIVEIYKNEGNSAILNIQNKLKNNTSFRGCD